MTEQKKCDLIYISLGAGVQSSVMARMAAEGELTPMPAFAVFADTQDEPREVYAWLEWLEKQLPFPVYRVSKGSLSKDALQVKRSKKSGKLYCNSTIPVFVKDGGMLRRHCTSEYKIEPIHRFVKTKLPDKKAVAEQWIGISTDEAHRMKDSRKPWIVHRWPLIESNMSRQDCLTWAERNGMPRPPRSACVYCPYHSDLEWMRLRAGDPEAWKAAIEFEAQLQNAFASQEVLKTSAVFLHRQRLPLGQVVFRDECQLELSGFGNECEGMCGV